MPIASKLVYFQRRRLPAPPEPDPEPPDPRRRSGGDQRRPRRSRSSLSSSHHKPGQELVLGDQRDAAKSLGSARNITEHAGGRAFSTGLNRSISDHSQLPDVVQQARERLLDRLNSVDLSRRRQKTWPSETILARLTSPADLGVLASADSILGCLTDCFQPSEPAAAACRNEESVRFPLSNADNHKPFTMRQKSFPELLHSACGGTAEGERAPEPPAECCICLERCCDAAGVGIGLVQLHCRHVFHSACLELWLRSHSDCPYCRASVHLS